MALAHVVRSLILIREVSLPRIRPSVRPRCFIFPPLEEFLTMLGDQRCLGSLDNASFKRFGIDPCDTENLSATRQKLTMPFHEAGRIAAAF